ncbi:MAG TPA: ArsR family transcriptional regulator [Nitrososphaerales archaeon]|nr:ArsR family transcriptional regulator [Nitrososphaerales archaeon]
MSGNDSRERVDYELRGKTMQVYLYLLKNGRAMGVREIQKELGFSSPSVAFHHLEKLIELGIVEKDNFDRYVLVKKVDTGILQAFVSVGGLNLPRLGFYAAFFSTIALAYVFTNFRFLDLYAIIGTLGGSAVFWYEAWRVWRRKPF